MEEASEYKICTTCKLEKNLKQEFYFHTKRNYFEAKCKTCTKARQNNYYQNNSEKVRKYTSNYAKLNKEKANLYKQKYVENNKEKVKQQKRKWKQENKQKVTADSNKRRSLKLKALPKWVDKSAIEQFYKNCPEGFHVDHIIPLRHPDVCGLHVLQNLQYLSSTDNLKKNNKFDGTLENNSWRN